MDGGAMNNLIMQEQPSNSHVGNDGISLKEFIGQIRKYIKLVWRRKFLWLYFLVPFILFFSYQYITFQPKYKADLTFMINEESTSSGGLSAVLGQFGFGGSSKGINTKKVNYLIKSKKIQRKAFFDSVDTNNSQQLLINQIIDVYSLDDKWSKADPNYNQFRFDSNNTQNLNKMEKVAFQKVYRFINNKKKGLISTSLDDEIGVYTIRSESINQLLSINLANELYKELSNFYVNQAIERQEATNRIMKNKVDSIELALNRTNRSIASFQDQSQSTWSNKSTVRLKYLQQEQAKLSTMYAEAVRNYEISSFSLNSQTPFFQEIDLPETPITASRFSILKASIISIVLSVILYLIYVFLAQIVEENT